MKKGKLFKLIVANLKKQGAKKIYLFGSYSRSQEGKSSGIDIIVDFANKKSLLELVRIERELSEATGKKIDLLTEKSISPLIIEHVKKEMVALYK